MKRSALRFFAVCTGLLLAGAGIASAGRLPSFQPTVSVILPSDDPSTNEPFPAAGDAYCSATDGCGTISSGGSTAGQWTAGDFVESSIFVLPTDSVTDLTAGWTFQDFLNGATETWFAYVNGVAVASVNVPDDSGAGALGNVSGTVTFAGIAPVAGGYQVELILQNTVPDGGGSVTWVDGGITGLSYETTTPEPGSMLLLGSGLALGGMWMRRKRRA